MKAMVLNKICKLEENRNPLIQVDWPSPSLGEKEILIEISACGVCHTELDEIEGRTSPAKLPIILGHQIVGRVEKADDQKRKFKIGERVGVAWIYSACGKCKKCLEGRENLCEKFKATGRDVNGGYAQYIAIPEDFAYKIPESYSDAEAAPLLCAGAIGYRSLRLTNLRDGEKLGLIGFGASAHLVIQMAGSQYPHSKVFVHARSEGERNFAQELGAFWVGEIE